MPLTFFLHFSEHTIEISKNEFFEEWLNHDIENRNSRLFEYISAKFGLADMTEDSRKAFQLKLASWSAKMSEKWESARRTKDRFLLKNKSWLEGAKFEFKVELNSPSTSTPVRHPGRPQKSFEESSFKTKKRRVEDIVQTWNADELTIAAEVANRSAGKRSVAQAIKRASDGSKDESGPKAVLCNNARQLSTNEALAYYVDSKCTVHSYKQTRKWSLKAGHQVFPSYHSLGKSKISCYTSKENILVTETSAEIKLQANLDKTTERLVEAQSEVIRSVLPCDSSFTLISKWGCDGSSGHSTYKQKFEDSEATDEFLFAIMFVPLRLISPQGVVVWQNPRPSSTLYCRPIKFIFAKETTELITTETNKVLEEASQLLPSLCTVGETQVSVVHKFILTMTDGKVCNALTNTRSAQKCYICGATPTMMNDESKDFSTEQDDFGFGLSTLHGWIRCFECLLHISYRLNIKKWQARSEDDKLSVKTRSDEIKLKFKKEAGLIVDKPKPGYGNTNDGNTARRFFANAELSANITGLDVQLIKNFAILLRTLSSGYEINLNEFEKHCKQTRQLYLSLYSWYYMPVTVHKLLVHSIQVIKTSLLPIGQFSEEAQEARNKDCRNFREHNTRKISRVATNTDLLNMLMITSDPLINSLRELPRKKLEKLTPEIINLINPHSAPLLPASCNLSREEVDYLVSDSSDCDSDDE